MINDVCLALGRPFVYTGVLGMTGQAMTVLPGRTACLRCLFEQPPAPGEIASCREAGIVGPVAAVIGEIEAAEAALAAEQALAAEMSPNTGNELGLGERRDLAGREARSQYRAYGLALHRRPAGAPQLGEHPFQGVANQDLLLGTGVGESDVLMKGAA